MELAGTRPTTGRARFRLLYNILVMPRFQLQEPVLRLCLLTMVLATVAACDEFATPAELAHPQILAIRAEPPVITPGTTATLELLIADADGRMSAPNVAWEVTSAGPGAPLLGAVEGQPDGTALYTAPTELAEEPALASVQATVDVGESAPLIAIKGIGLLSADLGLVNPTVSAFLVDEVDRLAEQNIVVAPGQTVALEIATEPASGDMATYAWYSTGGAIERYQSNPTEMVASETPTSGWLFAVTRDGFGGVAWHAVQLDVQ